MGERGEGDARLERRDRDAVGGAGRVAARAVGAGVRADEREAGLGGVVEAVGGERRGEARPGRRRMARGAVGAEGAVVGVVVAARAVGRDALEANHAALGGVAARARRLGVGAGEREAGRGVLEADGAVPCGVAVAAAARPPGKLSGVRAVAGVAARAVGRRAVEASVAAGAVAARAVQPEVRAGEGERRAPVVEGADVAPARRGVARLARLPGEAAAVGVVAGVAARAVGREVGKAARAGRAVAARARRRGVRADEREAGAGVRERLGVGPAGRGVAACAVGPDGRRVRALGLVARRAVVGQAEVGLGEAPGGGLCAAHGRVGDALRRVAGAARGRPVLADQAVAGELVAEAPLLEARAVEVAPVVVGVARGARRDHVRVEPLAAADAVAEGRVAREALCRRDAALPQRVARGAVADAFELGVDGRQAARRDQLGLGRRRAEHDARRGDRGEAPSRKAHAHQSSGWSSVRSARARAACSGLTSPPGTT